MKKICPKCGKNFECEHSANCWCADFSISKKIYNYMTDNYKDCLCKSCVKDFIKNEENNLQNK